MYRTNSSGRSDADSANLNDAGVYPPSDAYDVKDESAVAVSALPAQDAPHAAFDYLTFTVYVWRQHRLQSLLQRFRAEFSRIPFSSWSCLAPLSLMGSTTCTRMGQESPTDDSCFLTWTLVKIKLHIAHVRSKSAAAVGERLPDTTKHARKQWAAISNWHLSSSPDAGSRTMAPRGYRSRGRRNLGSRRSPLRVQQHVLTLRVKDHRSLASTIKTPDQAPNDHPSPSSSSYLGPSILAWSVPSVPLPRQPLSPHLAALLHAACPCGVTRRAQHAHYAPAASHSTPHYLTPCWSLPGILTSKVNPRSYFSVLPRRSLAMDLTVPAVVPPGRGPLLQGFRERREGPCPLAASLLLASIRNGQRCPLGYACGPVAVRLIRERRAWWGGA
ncbi:hypothetical protein FB45DRAFT_859877 [Roridomyces roridus]|uniref:Uncharacterized protein n=1 Tax=Roridomyces roridus TaxID=1738132 RepID=A0AAD7G214_9AGAR|nr:hypothetical protein FB45DRAFT_859877 [Roridomyces roridus]